MFKIDEYELEKFLGKGAFGEVYLTSRAGDPKKYATKKMDRGTIDKSEARKYLANEIMILKSLNHPNIVKFQDLKKTKNHYFLVMEFCNGGELSKALQKYKEKNGTAFPEELVQHFMRQIIDAFKYIHERKIIHRDVKLDNILLHYENEADKENFNLMKAQVKIIDFGFSCRINKSGLQYTVLGSPINMDPLILQKLNSSTNKTRQLGYNEMADIWSIGTVCYEMLIGKSAFDAEDMDDLVSKVENGSYSVPTTISSEIASFMNGMLQYEAADRLTAEQLSRHAFLTKQVSQFKKIDLNKIANNEEGGLIKVNTKDTNTFIKNSTIWSIYDPKSQDTLSALLGTKFIKPTDEKEEKSFEEKNKNAVLQLPSSGIPGNPTNAQVTGMTKEDLDKMQKEISLKESDYVFDGGIFG